MIIKHLSRLGLLGGATALALGVLAAQALAQGAGNAAGKTIAPPAGAAGAAAPGKTAPPVPGPGAAGAAAPGKTTTPSAGAAAPPLPNAAGSGAAAGTAAASTDTWKKLCGPTAAGKQACVMIYEFRTAQGQLVAQVSIQKVETDAKYTLRILLPVGVYLPPGVTLLVDGKGKAAEAKFTACAAQPAVCVAEGSFEAAIFDAMRKGTKIVMSAKSGQQKDMSFDLSLASFAKVYDGPGTTVTPK